ncbi:serine/threonine protein kinase, partial [Streptomyces sp. NPDC058394]
MEDWEQRQRETAERVLGQTAGVFDEQWDASAVSLLQAVVRLEFEQTSDGFRDETNWQDFYRAAVFFVSSRDVPRFTEAAIQHLLPTLVEVARQNGQDHVDRIR